MIITDIENIQELNVHDLPATEQARRRHRATSNDVVTGRHLTTSSQGDL